MKIKTTQFGELDVDEKSIIDFPRGLPGFESLRRFIVISAVDAGDINWLQSVDEPDLVLLLIDPFKYVKGYIIDIPDTELHDLEINKQEEAMVLTTLTIPRDNPALATTNLLAPIVLNARLNRGKQIILDGTRYSVKHSLFNSPSPEGNPEVNVVAGGEGI